MLSNKTTLSVCFAHITCAEMIVFVVLLLDVVGDAVVVFDVHDRGLDARVHA